MWSLQTSLQTSFPTCDLATVRAKIIQRVVVKMPQCIFRGVSYRFCSQIQMFANHSAVLCSIPNTLNHRGALPMLFLVSFWGGKIQAAGSCPVITLLAEFFLLCIYMLCQPKFTYYCFHTDLIIASTADAKFFCIPYSWSLSFPRSLSSYLPA